MSNVSTGPTSDLRVDILTDGVFSKDSLDWKENNKKRLQMKCLANGLAAKEVISATQLELQLQLQ